MILVDVNLLVYAKVSSLPQHEAARDWLDGVLSGDRGVGLPWTSLLGFVRLTTNRRIFERPLSVPAAWEQVRAWRELPQVFTPEPADRFPGILEGLLAHASRPELVPDAHLAALALEYGLMVMTTDADFGRFPGLRWENPLAG